MNLYKYALETARILKGLSRSAVYEIDKLNLPGPVIDTLVRDFGIEAVSLNRNTKKTTGLLQGNYTAEGARWSPSNDKLITIEQLNGFPYVKIQQPCP